MPMIESRYLREKLPDDKAYEVCARLETALRYSINLVRPNAQEYNITVEGDPFGPIALNQPDLRIYIFYHDDWNFTEDELKDLVGYMGERVREILSKLGLEGLFVKIRFYVRSGHASWSIS